MTSKSNLLEMLAKGPVIGDGSYVFTLEKRGYVLAGLYTPEVVIEHPNAVIELHKEFARAGADTLQAFTFHSADGKLTPECGFLKPYTSDEINEKACEIVKEVAEQYNLLICGGISPSHHAGKEAVQKEYQKQIDMFVQNKVDYVLAEFFGHIENTEWAIEVMKTAGLPVACTMRIGPCGDMNGVSAGECAVRMAKAGADIVGINCSFDPNIAIKTIKLMKDALEAEGLNPFLMMQPLGYWVPEVENSRRGYDELPECTLAMEPRQLTRWDTRRYAREAFDLGVHYIGGCCGFESHHIREMAEELAEERGKRPPGADKNGRYGEFLINVNPSSPIHKRTSKDHWMNLKAAMGKKDGPLLPVS